MINDIFEGFLKGNEATERTRIRRELASSLAVSLLDCSSIYQLS